MSKMGSHTTLSLTNRRYRVGSVFAGIGGICRAFKDASCKVVWANEIDKYACATYRLNNTETELFQCDIKSLKYSELPNIDILTAGFPCQPFSQAGHGRGFKDDRGALFFEIPKILQELKPKAYLLENVKTLTTHDNGQTLKTIREALTMTGYSFIPFILKANEYIDIPHGRERVYIVGFENESDYFYDIPIKLNSKQLKNCPLSSSFNIIQPIDNRSKGIEEFLEKSGDYYVYNDRTNNIHKEIMQSVNKKDTVYQFRRYYVRENKSNVCPTLTANMGSGGHNVPIVLDGKYPRKITPKECFNLQGFPSDFNLPDLANSQLYKQAGNSVVVPLVQKIAQEIINTLNQHEYVARK